MGDNTTEAVPVVPKPDNSKFPPKYRTARANQVRTLHENGLEPQEILLKLQLKDLWWIHYWITPRRRAWEMWAKRQEDFHKQELEKKEQALKESIQARAHKLVVLPGGATSLRRPGAELTQEQQQVIKSLYEFNPELSLPQIGQKAGCSEGSVKGVVLRCPDLLKRRVERGEKLLTAVAQTTALGMFRALQDDVEAGRVTPESMGLRDYAVATGILFDKLQLLTGGVTSRAGAEVPQTMDERKKALFAKLDEVDRTIKAVANVGKRPFIPPKQ